MKWVSYTRSISSRIGEENPSNTIAEQNERIARYLKKRGCSVSEKYSDRKRTAEATEGFDKLVQDGMARKFDAVAVDSIFRCGRTLPFAIEALQRTFYPLGIQFAVVEDDFCSADKTAEEVAEYFNGKTIDKIRSEFITNRQNQFEEDARAEELESAFSYDGYQVVRKELFAHLRDPAIVIRKDSITFNTACITGLEDVVYVHVMFNNDLKRIVVRGCDENDKDALRWCVAKPDKRKSRKMSCKPFATLVYQKMGWDSECRYKMLGYRITFEGETLYVFDLLVPEIFHEGQRKKNAVDSQDNAASTKPVNSRKGFYLDDIVGTFGVPVEEHRKESEVKQMDGYVSMGILTGKIAPEAGKD